MGACNIEIQELVKQLLYIVTIKDKVLSEKLNVAEAILAGRKYLVHTLYYIVGYHS